MIDPDKIYHKMNKIGREWVDKEHAASLLEETRKNVKAQFMVGYIHEGESVAKSDTLAEADVRYREHIEAMCIARKEANLAKVDFDSVKVWFEALRTAESSNRAQMNLR